MHTFFLIVSAITAANCNVAKTFGWQMVAAQDSYQKDNNIRDTVLEGLVNLSHTICGPTLNISRSGSYCTCSVVRAPIHQVTLPQGKTTHVPFIQVDTEEELHRLKKANCKCPKGVKSGRKLLVKETEDDIFFGTLCVKEVTQTGFRRTCWNSIFADKAITKSNLQAMIDKHQWFQKNWRITCTKPKADTYRRSKNWMKLRSSWIV